MIEDIDILNKSPKIGVLGDFIIDQYFHVEANKISPEFPIPILKSDSENPDFTYPGGAGNVCRQLRQFSKDVKYFGLINSNFLDLNMDVFFNGVFSYSFKNPIKKRYYQNDFPLCRLDIESDNYGLDSIELNNYQKILCENIRKYEFDVFILSDYSKGVFNNFEISNYLSSINKNCIKIVDPKIGPISKWKGCDVIKPNSKESQALTNKSNWRDQVDFIRRETGARCVIITQEGNGFVGVIDDEKIEYRPEVKTKAESVIGAGDCFISLFAIFCGCGVDYKKSAELAFKSSSMYVQRKYCNPISYLDLLESKLIKNPEVLQERNFTLAFTNGCFDIIHDGHLNCLKFAKSKAQKLVVALNSDLSVASLGKSHPLINNIESRINFMQSLEFVDYVVVFDESTPYEVINKIKPDVLVKSGEYKNPVGSDLVKRVEIFPVLENFSTTKIIEKIKNL